MPRSTVKSITKNTLSLSAAQIASVVFTMAFTVYAARVLGVEGFGKYALVRGFFDLFLSLAATGLAILLTREIAKQMEWAPRYLTTSFVLVAALVVAFTVVLGALGKLFHYAPDTEIALYLAAIALFPAATADLFEAAFVAFEHAEHVTYGTIIENILRTVLGLVALYTGLGLLSLFVILIVSRVAMVAYYAVAMHTRVSKLHWSFDWSFFKHLVYEWRIFAAENWLSTLFLSLGIIILSFFFGEGAVGPYAAADRTLSPLGLFAGSYTNAVFPHLSRSWTESTEAFHRITRQSIKYMLVLVLPAAILVGVFADVIIRILYTNAYAESIPILQVLIWVLVMRFTNPFLSFTLFARNEQTKSLIVAAVTFVAYLVFAFLLIPRYGDVGTAWSLALGMFTAFIAYFYFLFSDAGITVLLSDLLRVGLAAAVMGLFAVALRGMDLYLPIEIGTTSILAVGLYVVLLFALRVPSAGDLELLKKLMGKVAQRVNLRMGRVVE